MRRQDAQRAAALAALGQSAWDRKVDLAAFAELRERLAGLDTRAGELSRTSGDLEKRRAGLEEDRRAALERFASRRRAVEEKKAPIDAALREARSKKAVCEQRIAQAQSRLAAIAARSAVLDRETAALGSAAGPEAQPKLEAARQERTRLAAERDELGERAARDRDGLPTLAAEESRLAAESAAHAREIDAIEAERKAAVGAIDASLAGVRDELRSTAQQSGSVQKDRAGAFGSLGQALYESGVRDPAIADAFEPVAAVDRERLESRARLDASRAESASLAGGTMLRFWGVVAGLPLAAAALGAGAYVYYAKFAAPPPTALVRVTGCPVQLPPDQGKGTAVTADCTRSEGTFRAGRLEGEGRKTWANGESMQGTFRYGLLDGQGVRVYEDGRRFEGGFVAGRPMGQGKLTLKDGTAYEGRFWGLELLGYGVRRSAGEVVAGDWRRGFSGGIRPFGAMLRVRADGKREKIDAAALDPASAKPFESMRNAPPPRNDVPY